MTNYAKSQRLLKQYPARRKGASRQAPSCRFTKRGRGDSGPYRYVDPEVVFNHLLPDMRESGGGFAWACCPFHNDQKPSLCVNLASGWYRCASSSCGATGSNIVGFVGRLLALEQQEARRYLEVTYG